jgi:hypothetical protein
MVAGWGMPMLTEVKAEPRPLQKSHVAAQTLT